MLHFRSKRYKEWRFLQLSLLMIALLIITPLSRQHWLSQALVQVLMLDSLLVTLSAIGHRVRARRILWMLWLIAVIASQTHLLPDIPVVRAIGMQLRLGCVALLLLGCVVCILAFVFRNLRATIDSIFAAFTAYLLLAHIFASIFTMMHLLAPGSFRIPDLIAGASPESIRDVMLYFSFVTLATLGYGDIFPVTPTARMLTVIEAVVGQFYVAVVVSLLVGSLIARSQTREPPPGESVGD
jgi:hypothetical protein